MCYSGCVQTHTAQAIAVPICTWCLFGSLKSLSSFGGGGVSLNSVFSKPVLVGTCQMYLAMPSDCPEEPDGRTRVVPAGATASNVVLYISEDEGRTFTQVCMSSVWFCPSLSYKWPDEAVMIDTSNRILGGSYRYLRCTPRLLHADGLGGPILPAVTFFRQLLYLSHCAW